MRRLIGFIALFTLATSAAPSWSLSCAEIEALLAGGASRAQVEAQVSASGGDPAAVGTCIAALQVAAAEQSKAKVAKDSASAARPKLAEEAERNLDDAPVATRKSESGPAPAGRPLPAMKPSPPPTYQPSPSPAYYGAVPAVEQAIGTENYTDYGLNELVITGEDRQSTFSIDVDTASYAIARRKLQEGGMPPQAAVRVEEFVNAFEYGYAAPNDGTPFAVHLEATANPEVANRHVLRVGIQGKQRSGARKPVHLTFLVDVSGSMAADDKLGMAKRALHELVDNLGPEDTIALATYAGSERVVLEPTHTTRKAVIHAAIDDLSSGGGTAMGSGMELAYKLASDSYLHGTENRVIVLSDGDANIGRTSHDEILRTITQYAERGITLTTVGLGTGNYNDTMMEQLANKGDGNYFYIDSFSEAKKVFGTDLAGTIETIAKDVKIQVEFDPAAVHAYRLIGYENRDIADQDFRNDRVDAGEVGSGHQVTAVYDVVLKDGVKARDALATVRMRAKAPGPDSAAKEYTTTVPVSALQESWAESTPDLRMAWTTATFAEKLRGSPFAAEISYKRLHAYASAASRGTDADRELLELIAKAGSLSGEGAPVAAR